MINLSLVLFYHQFQREKRGEIKKGKPERSAGFVVVLFFGVVGWVRRN
jgi:hypothetical protein